MRIVEYWADNADGRSATRLTIDSEEMYCLVDGEPEDNSLARNFSFDVEQLLSKAYYAGEAGSGFNFVRREVSWEGFFDYTEDE